MDTGLEDGGMSLLDKTWLGVGVVLIHHRQRPGSGLCSPPVTLQWGGGTGKVQ